jgi:hypothetical protein
MFGSLYFNLKWSDPRDSIEVWVECGHSGLQLGGELANQWTANSESGAIKRNVKWRRLWRYMLLALQIAK